MSARGGGFGGTRVTQSVGLVYLTLIKVRRLSR